MLAPSIIRWQTPRSCPSEPIPEQVVRADSAGERSASQLPPSEPIPEQVVGACPHASHALARGSRPRNREWAFRAPDTCARDLGLFARYLALEVLELSDSVAGTGIAARVRALARPSKTTPRPWVYEAGTREGLEI